MRKETNSGKLKDNRNCNVSNDTDVTRTDNSSDNRKKRRQRRSPKANASNRNAIDTSSIEVKGRVMNNPNYYFTDPELARQATSISFSTFLGAPDDYSGEGTTAVHVTPTVMLVQTMPTAGPMDPLYAGTSGINMAGRKLYTRLSSINAKTTNYAPQDLITLMLALGSVLEMTSFLRRAFGLAFTTSYRNRVVPKEILRMMGINADDFFKNIAAYRLEFNTILNMLSKIPFPSNVAYFEKCATLHDHIWSDSEDMAIAQLYATAPDLLWKFNETYSEQGTGLNTVSINPDGNHIKQMSSYLNIFSDMVEQLMTSSTLNFIYADILNLAAKENIPLYQVGFLPENYVVVPEYSAEALLQIHNMSFVGSPETTNVAQFANWTPNNDVVPNVNKNTVDYYPSFQASDAVLNAKRIVDFPTGNPDTAQIIEATRYEAIATDANVVSDKYHITGMVFGDHAAVKAIIYNNSTVYAEYTIESSSIPFDSANLWYVASGLSAFDWCPILYGAFSTDKTRFTNLLGDLNYYTFIDREYLKRVNDLAMMALFELR